MSTDMVTYADYDGDEQYGAAAGRSPEEPPNPLLIVHRALRGRYVLAGMLGVLFAIPLAYVGYNALPPKYTSKGLINIAPTRPYILYENEFTERMSAFDSYVQSQANIVRSQRVLAAAVQNERLREAGWAPPPEGLIDLMKSVEVSVPRGGQDIHVSTTWTDPRLAQRATNAILEEYANIAIVEERGQLQSTIDTVTELREEARQARDDLRNRAYLLAEREGTDNLSRLLEAKHEQMRYIEAMLLEIEGQLSTAPAPAASDPAASDSGSEPEGVAAPQETLPSEGELERLATVDRELARLLDQRDALERELSTLSLRFGPEHRQILSLQDQLATLGELLQSRVVIARAKSPTTAGTADTIEGLRRQRDYWNQRLKEARNEAQRIGRVQLDIDRLREDAAREEERYREADARLQSLIVQRRDGQQGRISIAQQAETPLSPSTDRRIPLAAMGAAGGCGIGVGLVALLGLVKPRYRYIDDIDSGQQNVRILGAIPQIDPDDGAVRELMAASVHQIRAAMDARLLGTGSRGFVRVVTSATSGEGKSTITLRLARSFALSGKRTLVVDADMIGHGITSKLKMDDEPGFADAVLGRCEPLDAVRPGGEDNLDVLPAGEFATLTPERISSSAVSKMLASLREHYDCIVIDTGPILGSLEAQSIAPASDEVVLIVSRGRDVRHVRMAIDRLQRLGAQKIDIVFNRATAHDFERSTSLSRTSQRASVPPGGANGHAGADRTHARTRD